MNIDQLITWLQSYSRDFQGGAPSKEQFTIIVDKLRNSQEVSGFHRNVNQSTYKNSCPIAA